MKNKQEIIDNLTPEQRRVFQQIIETGNIFDHQPKLNDSEKEFYDICEELVELGIVQKNPATLQYQLKNQ